MVQNEINRQDFAKRLIQAAEHGGYSGHGVGNTLAKLFKVTPKAVSKWLNAETMPSRDRIGLIAKTLGVNRVWLEYGAEGMLDQAKGNHLESILDLGLSPENLRKVEDFARFLSQQDTSQNQ